MLINLPSTNLETFFLSFWQNFSKINRAGELLHFSFFKVREYHIFFDSRTYTTSKEKFSGNVKDLHKLKLLTIFYVYLTSFLGGVINYVFNI